MSPSPEGPEDTRSVAVETTTSAPPEAVWRALTDAEELRRWFPLDARIEPRPGGEIWLSWGPGCEGSATIDAVEKGRRLRWIETVGEGEGAVRLSVDFFVDGRAGQTRVRVVQAGFGASPDWDDWYDAVETGWTYFLYNLAHYLEHHDGSPRTLVWTRRPAGRPRDELWRLLTGPDGPVRPESDGTGAGLDAGDPWRLVLAGEEHAGSVVLSRPGHAFAGRCPGLDDALLFVELEGGGDSYHCGVWLSTWGLPAARTAALQEGLDEWASETLRSSGPGGPPGPDGTGA